MHVRRSRALVHVTLFALLAPGCFFYDSSWQQETHSQERQAAELTPDAPRAADEGGDGSRWRVLREVRVRAWATERYRAEVHAWQAHVGDTLERANEVLGPTLGVRLALVDARSWPQDGSGALDPVLVALEERDPADDVDLVMGFVGSTPQLSSTFDQLGMARMHGKHLVVRAMNDAAESDAIDEAFDRLSEEERARVRRRRKAHKELAVLLHEIGHVHGAIHVRDRAALMSPLYDEDMSGYAPHTVALMRPAAAERAKPEAERDDRAMLESLVEVLRGEGDWDDDERRAMLASYERALTGGAVQIGEPPQRDDRAGTLWDVTPLPPDDRLAFHEAREAFERGQLRPSWDRLAPLVERHADTYAVQELACELHNRRVAPDAARACQRMMQLASQFGRQ